MNLQVVITINKCLVYEETLPIAEHEEQQTYHGSRGGSYLLQKPLRADQANQLDFKDRNQNCGSTEQRLKCPQCYDLIRKQGINLPMFQVHTGERNRSDVVWLESGELSLVSWHMRPAYDFWMSKNSSSTCRDSRHSLKDSLSFKDGLPHCRASPSQSKTSSRRG